MGTCGNRAACERLLAPVARPALLYRTDWLGPADPTTNPEWPAIGAGAVESGFPLRAREPGELAGAVRPARARGILAGHQASVGNVVARRRPVFWWDCETNRFVAFARGTGSWRVERSRVGDLR